MFGLLTSPSIEWSGLQALENEIKSCKGREKRLDVRFRATTRELNRQRNISSLALKKVKEFRGQFAVWNFLKTMHYWIAVSD